MSRELSSLATYSQFIYSLLSVSDKPVVRNHTLRIYPRGSLVGVLEGIVEFDQDVTLRVYERIDFARCCILAYSYEVWQGREQLYWYDPTPHPNNPALAATHPHHKHVPPTIKHNRILAPGLSFEHPNLPFLLEEVKRQVLEQRNQ